MNQDWTNKLTEAGVPVSVLNGADADSGTPVNAMTELSQPLLVELSTLAVVDVSGSDAPEFFQAQICNDLNAIEKGELQLNGYCNPKGRLLALFTVYAHDDGFRLIVPQSVAPALVKRLQMFVMRAKVDIAIREDLVCTGLVMDSSSTGNSMAELDHLPALSDTIMQFTSNGSGQLLRCQDSSSAPPQQSTFARYISVANHDEQVKLWQSDKFKQVGEAVWRWLEINAGVPNVYVDSVEQFIPQMLNMQHIGALSFKKGCYPGQEIVARMQYLGKLKKHMKHLRIPGAKHTPKAGEVLTTDSNNNAGQVVDAVLDHDGLNLLAVVNIETQISDLRLADTALQEVELPYTVQPTTSEES